MYGLVTSASSLAKSRICHICKRQNTGSCFLMIFLEIIKKSHKDICLKLIMNWDMKLVLSRSRWTKFSNPFFQIISDVSRREYDCSTLEECTIIYSDVTSNYITNDGFDDVHVIICFWTYQPQNVLNLFLKVHWCKFENLPISLSSHENDKSKISHWNTFYVLRYTQVRYVKSLFTNIGKQ